MPNLREKPTGMRLDDLIAYGANYSASKGLEVEDLWDIMTPPMNMAGCPTKNAAGPRGGLQPLP